MATLINMCIQHNVFMSVNWTLIIYSFISRICFTLVKLWFKWLQGQLLLLKMLFTLYRWVCSEYKDREEGWKIIYYKKGCYTFYRN